MVWVVGTVAVLLLAAVGFVVGRRAVTTRAEALLADGIRQIEDAVVAELGGTAHVTVEGEPVPVLLGLRQQVYPAGRLVVERCRLPNGLAVRHAELTTAGGLDAGHVVARIHSSAISEQLGVPGMRVQMHDDRLRLAVGMASLTVRVEVVDGRVVLSIPVAPPPLGQLVSAGLTELVPRPPEGVELHDVAVVGHELVVRAVVDLGRLVELGDGRFTA